MAIHFGVTPQKAQQLVERMEALGIREGDLEESFIRAGGPGGQHANKTSTAVRLLHAPTGLEVRARQARSQSLNRYYARKRLCELMEARQQGEESPEEKKRAKAAKQKARRKRRSRSAKPKDEESL